MRENRIKKNHFHINYEGDFFMENKGIVYIDYLEDFTDVLKFNLPVWLKWIVYKIFNFFGVIKVKDNFFVLMKIQKDNINEKMMENLKEKLEECEIKNIICADSLRNDQRFNESF